MNLINILSVHDAVTVFGIVEASAIIALSIVGIFICMFGSGDE